jgi:histidine triad (HIT) family protein
LTCDFCEIVNGTVPAVVVGETSGALAVLPLHPATKGHTLVIPKIHLNDFLEVDDATAGELARTVTSAGRALSKALRPDGMNVITSAGAAATQTVPHLHIHVVPRWHDDAIGPIWPSPDLKLDALRDELATLLRPAFEAFGL